MSTTAAQRAVLYNGLVETIGEEAAAAMMDELPPGGWEHMATKDDLKVILADIRSAFAETNARFDQINAQFAQVNARFDETNARITELGGATKERFGESFRTQAWMLLIVVATIVVSALPLWIELFS